MIVASGVAPVVGVAGWSLLAGATASLVIVAVSLALALWQLAVARRRRPRRTRRLLAVWLLIASLTLLALGPARRLDEAGSSTLLITAGAGRTAPSAWRGAIYRLADAALDPGAVAGAVTGTIIPDAAWLARDRPPGRLRVVGHGLEAWEWPAFSAWTVEAVTAPLDPGLADAGWARALRLGESWRVAGRLVGLGAGTLRLEGPGGEVDHRAVQGDTSFVLHARPRAAGRWRYRLAFAPGPDNPGPARAEHLDVWVRPAQLPRVLWLEAAPGFESRYLKAWLSTAGGAWAMRQTISRGRFRFERHNLPALDLSRLRADLLAGFDLVVADERSLSRLPRSARVRLHTAVEEGLGLLLLAAAPTMNGSDQAPVADLAWTRMPVRAAAATPAEMDEGSRAPSGDQIADARMALRIAWDDGSVSAPLAVSPREIAVAADVRPLLADRVGRVVAAVRDIGRGQVARSLVEDSFRWVLEGNAIDHRRLWSRLLGAIARPRPAPRIILPSGPLLVDRPLEIVIEDSGGPRPGEAKSSDASAPAPPGASLLRPGGDQQRLAWRQDALNPDCWQTTIWPAQPGWYRLQVAEQAAWMRVEPATAWTTWQQAGRQRATRLRAALGAAAGMADQAGSARVFGPPRPFGKAALAALALAAAAFLWLDERRAVRAAVRCEGTRHHVRNAARDR